MKHLTIMIILTCCLLATPRVWPVEPLSAAQLQQVCADYEKTTEGPYALLCLYYVKGFLDGAVATDERVANNVASEIEERETITQRGIRNRIGSRIKKFGPSVYAEFCVGQPDPIVDVIRHVIEELERHKKLESIQAQKIVYDSLRRHYPCKAE